MQDTATLDSMHLVQNHLDVCKTQPSCNRLLFFNIKNPFLAALPTADTNKVDLHASISLSIHYVQQYGCFRFKYLVEGSSVFDILVTTTDSNGEETVRLRDRANGKFTVLPDIIYLSFDLSGKMILQITAMFSHVNHACCHFRHKVHGSIQKTWKHEFFRRKIYREGQLLISMSRGLRGWPWMPCSRFWGVGAARTTLH